MTLKQKLDKIQESVAAVCDTIILSNKQKSLVTKLDSLQFHLT